MIEMYTGNVLFQILPIDQLDGERFYVLNALGKGVGGGGVS